jgi:type II secretory pathway pseudopilin PulG
MLSRVRQEDGFTIVELLVGMVIMIVVLGATMSAFDVFGASARRSAVANDTQDLLRRTVDRMAVDVRNAGSPGLQTPAVERAGGDDFVFMTVDPLAASASANATRLRRIRYCLDASTPTRAKLYRQAQTWTTTTPTTLSTAAGCPDASYGPSELVADHIVNRAGGATRPVFAYDATAPADIASVGIELLSDIEPATRAGERRLSSALHLRNQNRMPSKPDAFTATPTGGRHVLLNGSSAVDADGDTLTYQWYDGSTPIGGGPLLDYTAPATGSRTFSLKVTDPAGLTSTSDPKTVNVT